MSDDAIAVIAEPVAGRDGDDWIAAVDGELKSGDTLLAYTVPRAEYMFGCTPTAFAMILGYYDLYGYAGLDYSNLIAGDIAVASRGSDGNIYNMNETSLLGSFIASEEHVYRFFSTEGVYTGTPTTAAHEAQYTFTGETDENGLSIIDTDSWNCLADYLGTNQMWRRMDNYSTRYHLNVDLQTIVNRQTTENVTIDGTTHKIDWRYTSMLYGLMLYVESRGYGLDLLDTGTYTVDVCGGNFTFADYMAEIDAGRIVLVSIEGHSMVGYGYNAATREIIFDDTYRHDQRMSWSGTYFYSDEYRKLQSITVLALTGGTGDTAPPILAGGPTAAVEGYQVTITWAAASDDTGVAGYTLKINDDTYDVAGTGYVITLAAGSYRCSIQAYDQAGNRSGWSDAHVFAVPDITPPEFAVEPGVRFSSGAATFSWEAGADNVGVAHYLVELDGEVIGSTTELSFSTAAPLSIGTHRYRIGAVDAAGNTTWSDEYEFPVEEHYYTGYFEIFSASINRLNISRYWTVELDAGVYSFAGDFAGLSGTLYLTDAAGGRTVGSRTVKKGVLNAGQPLLLDGTYHLSFVSADRGATGGQFQLKLFGDVFPAGDPEDDDFSRLTPDYRIAIDAAPVRLLEQQWVGYNDAIACRLADFAHDGKYTFAVTSSDAVKLTIAVMQPNGKLKNLKSVTVKANVPNTIKDLLLDAGEYYLSVQSTNAKKGGNATYNIDLAGVFFTKGDNTDDVHTTDDLPRLAVAAEAKTLLADGWVGYKDEFDYAVVNFAHDGKYTFAVTSSDAVKLTIAVMQPNGKLKNLKSVTVKAGAENRIKDLLLDAGEYYLSIQSTNAKKGGNATYSVDLAGVFFTKGDNTDDVHTTDDLPRLAVAAEAKTLLADGWVGYKDEFDYAVVNFAHDGKYTFAVTSSDAVKLTIAVMQPNGKLKNLKSVTVKAGAENQIKDLLLDAGEYYLSVQSTNAKKGGDATYGVELDGIFFTKGDTADNWIGMKEFGAADLDAAYAMGLGDTLERLWVGYNDAIDYRKLDLAAGAYTATFQSSDQAKLTIYELLPNGNSGWKLKAVKSLAVSGGKLDREQTLQFALGDGAYFLAVESTNAKKGGSATYSLSLATA